METFASEAKQRSVVGKPGPVFLVGMPRSGTKLLREMLNEHPLIHFSDIETDFLPYWVAKWAKLMPQPSRHQFEQFYKECLKLPFFVQNAERGLFIDRDEWFAACEEMSPSGVFGGLMRCCLKVPRSDRNAIWGDKSPSYIRHVTLLTTQFPEARVVHITRDVRDYCLSIHDAWGKSMLRAAQRWQDDVSRARTEGRSVREKYIEIRYEDLLANPHKTLHTLSTFLGVPFDERTINPSRIVENKGAARNTSTILRNNTEKYRTRMSPRLVSQIEEIACVTLRELRYSCDYQGPPKRVPGWRLRMLQCRDGWNVILGGARSQSVIQSIKYNINYFRISGNRR